MLPSQVFATCTPEESADWGFARTKRVLLRRPDCELGQSTYCVPIGPLLSPNRDYPYEGLSAIIGGENWKFLDGIAFGLKDSNAKFLALKQEKVKVSPWQVQYHFSFKTAANEPGSLEIDYYLLKDAELPTLSVQGKLQAPNQSDFTLRVAPIADLRFMYEKSDPDSIEVRKTDYGLALGSKGKWAIVSGTRLVSCDSSSSAIEWNYKLGTGERMQTNDGIKFKPVTAKLLSAGFLEVAFQDGLAEIQCSCIKAIEPERQEPIASRSYDLDSELKDQSALLSGLKPVLSRAQESLGESACVALSGRASVLLSKFGNCGPAGLPDAGAYWFRNAWLRDVFETAYVNFPLFYSHNKRGLKSWVAESLKLYRNGLVPNKLAETTSGQLQYNSLDATLLCLLTGFRYVRECNDTRFKAELKRKTLESIKAFGSPDSAVKLHSNGLLACPASYGWIDSIIPVGNQGVLAPNRIPRSWSLEIISKAPSKEDAEKELASKSFYLAEANAQWMRLLQDVADMGGGSEPWAEDLLELLKANYESTFWANGFVSHIADPQTGKAFEGDEFEGVESSVGIVCASLLPEVFDKEKAQTILDRAREKLFVKRGGKLFGLLLRNDLAHQPYFDDSQYHAGVVWPRDTPYLIDLLQKNSLDKVSEEVRQLLESNLEHQMQEGVVFFNHELLSQSNGKNPNPTEGSDGFPVPVKNPAQLWSQWVQPYVNFVLA